MTLALVRDDLAGTAGVSLREEDGALAAEVSGAEDVDAVARQVARVMSLDHDGSAYPEVGVRDPVVGRAMAAAPGLRPVLFNTPYEAAAPALPRSLGEALQALRENEPLRNAFGAGFIDYFIHIKEAELTRFEQEVSEWEHREYFDLF